MIEIRELVIRANIDSSGRGTRERPGSGTSGQDKKGCCAENLDLMLKVIKEKNER
jgi:hypothetical protein